MSPKRTDDLGDLTVRGIWVAHLEGEYVPAGVVDDVAVRAAGVLAEKGYWTWMFQAATTNHKIRVKPGEKLSAGSRARPAS